MSDGNHNRSIGLSRPKKTTTEITHQIAAYQLGIPENRLSMICKAGLGPKREKQPKSGTGRGSQWKWVYDPASLAAFRVPEICTTCGGMVPDDRVKNKTSKGPGKYGPRINFCCDACQEAYRGRLQGRNRKTCHKMTSWEAVCPACGKKHIYRSKYRPSCKWIYCTEHAEYRNRTDDTNHRLCISM
jgi:hypothetical protein